MMIERNCFNCGSSMVTDEDELYCPLLEKVVKDTDICDECNV